MDNKGVNNAYHKNYAKPPVNVQTIKKANAPKPKVDNSINQIFGDDGESFSISKIESTPIKYFNPNPKIQDKHNEIFHQHAEDRRYFHNAEPNVSITDENFEEGPFSIRYERSIEYSECSSKMLPSLIEKDSMYKIDKIYPKFPMVPSKTRKVQPINQNINQSPILGNGSKHGRAQSIYSMYKDDQSVLDGINNELKIPSEKEDRNNIFPVDKLINSPDMTKRVDTLINEIKDLKHNKANVELKLNEESMKVLKFQKEVIQLREQLNYYKLKEIKEGEGVLKLEIQSLKNNVNFKTRENELLNKQNASLNNHIIQLQNYIKNYIESKKRQVEYSPEVNEKEEEISTSGRSLIKDNHAVKPAKTVSMEAKPASIQTKLASKLIKPKEVNLFDETSNTDDLFSKGNNTVHSKFTDEGSPNRRIKSHTVVNQSVSPPVSNRTSLGLPKVGGNPHESVEELFNSPPRSNENFKKNNKFTSPPIKNIGLINKPKVIDLVEINKENANDLGYVFKSNSTRGVNIGNNLFD